MMREMKKFLSDWEFWMFSRKTLAFAA